MESEVSHEENAVTSEATPLVELHIEELTLHGFPAADRHAIAGAVERELARLLGERSESSQLLRGEFAHLNGGTFTVASDATPQLIGQQIAQAIYSGLER